MDAFSVWEFCVLGSGGGVVRFRVCAACEYDAWRIVELVLGVRVD